MRHEWRGTFWYPLRDNDAKAANADWDATTTSTPPLLIELYYHRGDDGSDSISLGVASMSKAVTPAELAQWLVEHGAMLGVGDATR